MQIDNNKIREDTEATKFELTNKVRQRMLTNWYSGILNIPSMQWSSAPQKLVHIPAYSRCLMFN